MQVDCVVPEAVSGFDRSEDGVVVS
jgi:hypothetical protein